MTYCIDDTIVAIASAPGGAVRGIVRISGSETLSCLLKCFQPLQPPDLSAIDRPTVVRGQLQIAKPIGLLPVDLYWWPTRRSYTRQIAAELHTVGSPPLLDGILQTLCASGARLANPGEFTLRAFLAGRLDLTQAEAVLGVIDAQDTPSLATALTQLAGGLATPLGEIRSDLLDLLADLEAGLDFADEEIAFVSPRQTARRLELALRTVDQILTQISSRSVASHGPRVVLRGWPNVGKSSLLNALAGGEVAIVFHEAGTTRDYVTRPFHWHSVTGLLIDTAGLEEGPHLAALSTAAQQAAQSQYRQADLELLCLDATRPLHQQERALLLQGDTSRRLVVWTKIDAGDLHQTWEPGELRTSSQTNAGIELLRQRIAERLVSPPPTCAVASTVERCQQSLIEAAEYLRRGHLLIAQGMGEELVALELRGALEQLAQIVGAVYTDDILDRVFSRFCIGK